MISSKNIFYHELIGLELKVVDSSNPSLIGLEGTVIDETKKTLRIEVKEKVQDEDLSSNQNDFNFIYKEKLIQKDVSVFQFKVPDGTIVEIKLLQNGVADESGNVVNLLISDPQNKLILC